jgi:formate dehydrogenase iron-sulfur subunit
MAVDRRTALKGMMAAGAAAFVGEGTLSARERKKPPEDAVGMLYDATLCIGCKTCVVACKEANGLPSDTTHLGGGVYDLPNDLSDTTKNIIKLYKDEDKYSYMKAQCMHCVDPACINACMLGSLQKREHGVVTWHGERCTGCRYCGIACPYGVPKYEYHKAWPKVIKCEMCATRKDKPFQPACCEVCPRHAVIFGKYTDLVDEAKNRLEKDPDRYYPKVFGLEDGGGTQVLYLSKAGISFQDLGLPDLGVTPVPEVQQTIQHALYQGAVAPVALFAVFGAVMWRNKRAAEKAGEEKP